MLQAFQFESLHSTSLSQNYYSIPRKPLLSLISSSSTFSHKRACSSTPDLNAKNSVLAEYLTGSLKFSTDRALSVCSSFARTKSLENSKEVVNFLKGLGLSDAHIQSIVRVLPRVLFADVEKNLKPKVSFLQEMGLAGPCICSLISRNPYILQFGLDRTLKPCIHLIKEVLNRDGRYNSKEQVNDDLLRILSRCSTVGQLKCRLEANITYLESCGVVGSQLSSLLLREPSLFAFRKEKLEKIVSRAVDMNFSMGSRMLAHAIRTLSRLSIKRLNSRFEVFMMFGFSKDEIASMFRSSPLMFGLSEENLRCKLEFFLKKFKMDNLVLVRNPTLLTLSLEKRVIPRCKVIAILKSRRLLKDFSFTTAMYISNELFVEKYILPFKNDSEELVLAAYEGKLVDTWDLVHVIASKNLE